MSIKSERRSQYLIELIVVCAVGASAYLSFYIGDDRMGTKFDTSRTQDILCGTYLSGPTPFDMMIGAVPGAIGFNVFGYATDLDNGEDTDVWDGANSSDNLKTYIHPTQARIHSIVSTSALDTIAGTGARSVFIHGLESWNGGFVTETVNLNGTSPVNTVRSYVAINRMITDQVGSLGENQGKISATAQTDGTITALMIGKENITQMAILNVPSKYVIFISGYYASIVKGNNLVADFELRYNRDPANNLLRFENRNRIGLSASGNNYVNHKFVVPFRVDGPAIIKITGTTDTNNTVSSAGFDVIVSEKDVDLDGFDPESQRSVKVLKGI